MTTITKKIDRMKELDRRIDVWGRIAETANRIGRYADAKCRTYSYEQKAIISDLSIDDEVLENEAKKEFNRRKLKVETDL